MPYNRATKNKLVTKKGRVKIMESKVKLLKVLDILSETDSAHPITATKICQILKSEGADAERKSVCRDINTLINYGYRITLCRDNKLGYYMEGAKSKRPTADIRPTQKVVLEYKKEDEECVEKIFGKKARIIDEENYKAEFSVISSELFSKLLLAAGKAQLFSPEETREEFMRLLDTALTDYNKPKSDRKIEVWLL